MASFHQVFLLLFFELKGKNVVPGVNDSALLEIKKLRNKSFVKGIPKDSGNKGTTRPNIIKSNVCQILSRY